MKCSVLKKVHEKCFPPQTPGKFYLSFRKFSKSTRPALYPFSYAIITYYTSCNQPLGQDTQLKQPWSDSHIMPDSKRHGQWRSDRSGFYCLPKSFWCDWSWTSSKKVVYLRCYPFFCCLVQILLVWEEAVYFVKENYVYDSTVKQGVPQGSILGPVFFLLFVNDMPLRVQKWTMDIYADDTTLSLSSNWKTLALLNQSLSQDLSEVERWSKIQENWE